MTSKQEIAIATMFFALITLVVIVAFAYTLGRANALTSECYDWCRRLEPPQLTLRTDNAGGIEEIQVEYMACFDRCDER
jgi:hypothetical protein